MIKGKDLAERYEMVTGGGFINATDATSTRRDQTKLSGNHEKAETKLILHDWEAADRGYERVLAICRYTDILLLLVHFMSVVEVWVIVGTAKKRKCYPVHEVSQRLTQPVRDNLLSFHALTGCDTTSAFSSDGKKSYWKTFQKHPFLVSGVGYDGELAAVEECAKLPGKDLVTNKHITHRCSTAWNRDVEFLTAVCTKLPLFQMPAWNWWHAAANQSARLHYVPASRRIYSTLWCSQML